MNLICTLTLEEYFTTSGNYVMAEDQPISWLCKLHANCISKSKIQEIEIQPKKKVQCEDFQSYALLPKQFAKTYL